MSKFLVKNTIGSVNVQCLDKNYKNPKYNDNTVIFMSDYENEQLYKSQDWKDMTDYGILKLLDNQGILASQGLFLEPFVANLDENHPMYVQNIDIYDENRNHLSNINNIDITKPYAHAMLNYVSGNTSGEWAEKDFNYCGFKFSEIHDYWKTQTDNHSTGRFKDFYDELYEKEPGYLMTKNMIIERDDDFSIFINGKEFSKDYLNTRSLFEIKTKLSEIAAKGNIEDLEFVLDSAINIKKLFPKERASADFERLEIRGVFEEITKNPNLTEELALSILDNKMLDNNDYFIYSDVARNAKITERIFAKLTNEQKFGSNHFIMSRLAENNTLTKGMLEHMLYSKKGVSEIAEFVGGDRDYSFMLERLAKNPNATKEFLDDMTTNLIDYVPKHEPGNFSINYPIQNIMANIAENPNASPFALDTIYSLELKGHNGTTLEGHKTNVLSRTRNMKHIDIELEKPYHNSNVKAMASNPNIEPEYLTKVIQKHGNQVDYEALRNPNLIDEHFRILSEDKNRNFSNRMKMIIEHPSVPKDVLQKLSNDTRADIAELANKKLLLNQDVNTFSKLNEIEKIHQKIQNNEEVPSSEFSKINFESEAFNSLDDDIKETITNYVNERSDAINADALEKDKQQSISTDLNV